MARESAEEETGLINDRNAITVFDENADVDVCSYVAVYTLLNYIFDRAG